MDGSSDKTPALLKSGARVINFGMTSFSDDLTEQDIPVIQMEWVPKTAGKDLLSKLKRLKRSELGGDKG